MTSERKAIILKLAIVTTFVVGAFTFLYPFVANILNAQIDHYRIEQLSKQTEQEAEKQQQKERKRAEEIKNNPTLGIQLETELFDEVEKSSPLTKNEISEHLIGSISIPKINSQLPIFDETTPSFLQEGITLLPGSSYPTGGKSSHAVLTGHTGLPSKKLFTDLKDLVIGDVIYLKIAEKNLAYKVDQIKTVLPNQLDDLKIQEGEDYLTLVTCTPYMVNTHRLLVRGHRVPVDQKQMKQKEQEINKKNNIALVFYLMLLISLVSLLLYVIYRQYINYQITGRRYRLKVQVLYDGISEANQSFVLVDSKKNPSLIETKSNTKGEIRLKGIKGGRYLLIPKEEKGKSLEIICFVKHYKDTYFSTCLSKKSDSQWELKVSKE
ncbi:class C sortase [Vagococcus carniphilus]|uniref:Class C sortase n=1 Tax=Vagococcus carniphilus TaxID=218144 RepID=A0A430AVC0_9ENTE|nr:class C sortase [Vagococcus carniphilus]QNN73111.1 class C sortase [Vagococcus carniphilus]RSU12001.1 hypothetical protein CBF28_11560 [Vagococcus carniphilus]